MAEDSEKALPTKDGYTVLVFVAVSQLFWMDGFSNTRRNELRKRIRKVEMSKSFGFYFCSLVEWW